MKRDAEAVKFCLSNFLKHRRYTKVKGIGGNLGANGVFRLELSIGMILPK
jgi:hypothetical protein